MKDGSLAIARMLSKPPMRLVNTASATLVIDGRRISSMRDLPRDADDDIDEAERIAAARRELQRARDRARYLRVKNDPAEIAKRQAWYEANREKVLTWKRDYNARNRKRIQECQTAWMRRKYRENPDPYIAASRRYYASHRAEILAKKKAQRDAAKACDQERLAA